MVALEDVGGSLLQKPSNIANEPPSRAPSAYKPLDSFALQKQRTYQQQYGDMYFLRLTKIKPAVDRVADAAWSDTIVAGEAAKRVERVLDVRQGELCWVTGTVYMEMALKPNILEDVSKDRWISAPLSTQKYFSDDGSDQIMLEDESGRIRLVGDMLKRVHLVSGCIIAVMGTENANGELEAIDIKFADLPPQPERWALSKPVNEPKTEKKEVKEEQDSQRGTSGGKVAIVSGLSFSATDASHALDLDLLLEYLLGEALSPEAQVEVSQISRLIIAGDSISAAENKPEPAPEAAPDKKVLRKYGYDASAYNPVPSQLLDSFLAELLPSIPVTLLPGVQDPANASYPQQPIHPAMFPKARVYSRDPSTPASKEAGWFDTVTNPWEGEVEGWRFLGTGGQNVDDMFKYVGSDDRIGMMEAMCRWRCCAPTAPDTLWSYPFQDDDPFVINECPHLYFVGCQPSFTTRVIHGPEGQSVRLITVPSFKETREVVIVDTETLEVNVLKIATN